MADILFKCPQCQKSLAVDERGAGRNINCPDCGKSVEIPQPDIAWECSNCRAQHSGPESCAGTTYKCPSCKIEDRVPLPEDEPDAKPKLKLKAERNGASPSTSNTTKCPFCGASIAQDALICVGCGMDFRTGNRVASRQVKKSSKLPIVFALVLVLLMVGIAVVTLLPGRNVLLREESPTGLSTPPQAHVSVPLPQSPSPAPPVLQNATLKGGFWITKGTGASDVLRGQRIYLLPAKVPSSPELRDLLARSEKSLKEGVEYIRRQLGESSPVQHLGNAKELMQTWARHELQSDDVGLRNLHRMIVFDTDTGFSSSKPDAVAAARASWLPIVSKYAVSETTTGIDGKYTFDDVKAGEYLVYSCWQSSFSTAEWCVPVSFSSGETKTLDLCNDNSEEIVNFGQ